MLHEIHHVHIGLLVLAGNTALLVVTLFKYTHAPISLDLLE